MVSVAARPLVTVAPRRAGAASEQRLLDQVDFQHAAVQTLPQVRASVTERTGRRDCRLSCIGAGGQIQFREEE